MLKRKFSVYIGKDVHCEAFPYGMMSTYAALTGRPFVPDFERHRLNLSLVLEDLQIFFLLKLIKNNK